MGLIHQHGAASQTAADLRFQRDLFVAPRRSARREQREVGQAGRDFCRLSPVGYRAADVDFTAGHAGHCQRLQIEHLGRLLNELVYVDGPLQARRTGMTRC